MTQEFDELVVVNRDWDERDGALRLTGDKPTMKLAAGPIAGNASWIVHIGSNGPGNLEFFEQGATATSWDHVMSLTRSGRVGVGTVNPLATTEIVGNWTGREGALRLTGDKPTMKLAAGPIAGNATWIVHVGSNGPGNLEFFKQDGPPDSWKRVMALTADGNVLVEGDIQLTGNDCAEEFDILGPEVPDPGTVMVLDEAGAVRASDSPYDHRVAGVISGAGDYQPAVIMGRGAAGSSARRALALMGKAYCKVDANSGSIGVGDLLTTSTTAGHAMKATDRSRALGSVLGKALRPLDKGQGLLPVLIALQ